MISLRWLAYSDALIALISAAVNERLPSVAAEKSPPLRETGDAPATLSSKPNEEGEMPEDVPLKVEAWPIERVIACANNSRKRAAAVDKLAASVGVAL
jgi:hypothetical protein